MLGTYPLLRGEDCYQCKMKQLVKNCIWAGTVIFPWLIRGFVLTKLFEGQALTFREHCCVHALALSSQCIQLQDSSTSCCLVQTLSNKSYCFCPSLSLIFFRRISFCLNAAHGQNSNWNEYGGSCAYYAPSALQLQDPVAGEPCLSCPA